jgi:NTP pyrophosphatase (non-canonical NTP hydrolase)
MTARTGLLALRPSVIAFAQAMERKLRANDHKGGWHHDSAHALSARLREEHEELHRVIEERTASASDVLDEAADVANFAMMIADVCGGLSICECGSWEPQGPKHGISCPRWKAAPRAVCEKHSYGPSIGPRGGVGDWRCIHCGACPP